MPYKNSKKSLRQIAKELHADAVIEGFGDAFPG
jgi:hypothetical protein